MNVGQMRKLIEGRSDKSKIVVGGSSGDEKIKKTQLLIWQDKTTKGQTPSYYSETEKKKYKRVGLEEGDLERAKHPTIRLVTE